jgi:agmatine deiminase
MLNRRTFIQSLSLAAGGVLLGNSNVSFAATNNNDVWFMPDESELHKRTWMSFGASIGIWGSKLLPEVRKNLALIAKTIAAFEPVTMLVNQEDYTLAKKLVGTTVELVVCPLDDLWIRDHGAVFVVTESGQKAAIDFNFNGWGEKQAFSKDVKVARFMSQHSQTKSVESNLTLEGGGIEVDGQGTAIITESCVLNSNRNPTISKARCEEELKDLLGLEKIIWLPGIKGKDITDGHTDFYARFTKPGIVVAGYDPDPHSWDHEITKRHIEILRKSTDAQGRQLEVVVLEAPSKIRDKFANDDFAAGYINFYVCNGAVIMPEFGDKKADLAAKNALARLFPNRKVVQINIDGIAAGGGGIHCATQQEPSV